MELYGLTTIFCGIIIIILLGYYTWKFMNLVWFRPRKVEKSLRQQGLAGNRYRILFGDFKEMSNMGKDALSKPINFSDDYVPRVIPFIHQTLTNHGMYICMYTL